MIEEKIFSKDVFYSSSYRISTLSAPVEETEFSRKIWKITSNVRLFSQHFVFDLRTRQLSPNLEQFVQRFLFDTLEKIGYLAEEVGLDKERTIEGFLGRDWNADLKHPTVFDILTEALNALDQHLLETETIIDEESWILETAKRIRMSKARYTFSYETPYRRPGKFRRHQPFDSYKDIENHNSFVSKHSWWHNKKEGYF